MSDSLRDRIAAVLKTANDRVAGFIGYDEMADAVLRELDSQGLLIDSEAGNRLNRLEGRR